jgi:hypothetical protein
MSLQSHFNLAIDLKFRGSALGRTSWDPDCRPSESAWLRNAPSTQYATRGFVILQGRGSF